MNAVMCKECGYSFENKESGKYFCPNCHKEVKFFEVEAFCGAKPNELNEVVD
jgi:rubrerythrin